MFLDRAIDAHPDLVLFVTVVVVAIVLAVVAVCMDAFIGWGLRDEIR